MPKVIFHLPQKCDTSEEGGSSTETCQGQNKDTNLSHVVVKIKSIQLNIPAKWPMIQHLSLKKKK